MNECADCAPQLHGFSYISEQAISVVFQCGCGPAQFTFMHEGAYACPCGQVQAIDANVPLTGRMAGGRPVLQFTCDACGQDFEDDRFTAR